MLQTAPVILPLITAVLLLFFRANVPFQRWFHLASSAVQLLAAVLLLSTVHGGGIQVAFIGGWQAPFGISLVADLFSAVMVVIGALMNFAGALYALGSIDKERESFGFYPLINILMMGIQGSFLTGDMFNLFVWFEVMLISSFVLIALGGLKAQLEGAIKYVTINLISSVMFLMGLGVLYGIAGTLNMADLARTLPGVEEQGLVTAVSIFFLISFGIKSALFPLFFWLPASYHTPPAVVSALFAGLLTKVGVYALIRVFSLLFTENVSFIHFIILALAGFTMVTGVLGAAAQNDIRRILSFHIVSQIGYMVMGLGLFTPLAIAGSVFYIIHHIIVKTNLFLVGGVVRMMRGTYSLPSLGGFYKAFPFLGVLFLIPALSLAGIPPLSGFWAKFVIVKAGFLADEYFIAGTALFVGLLTLFSMTKIWNEVFWKNKPEDAAEETVLTGSQKFFLFTPIVLLALITLTIGLYAEPFMQFATQTAEQLIDPTQYIRAVLGEAAL